MRSIIAALALTATSAQAEIARERADGTVAEAMDQVEAVVQEAGAIVFARVDHGTGAAEAGLDLPDAQLLIFGNPALGTPAMQSDILAGLYLPLRILVYSDAEGQTWVAYEEIDETFDGLTIDEDAEFVTKMEQALERFAGAAAND